MKKLMIAAVAAMLGVAANAAAVTWSVSPVDALPDATPAAANWAIYVMDASTYDAFMALDADKIAGYVTDNAIYSGKTAEARGGAIMASVKDGNYSANQTVSSYMVLFSNGTAADADYYANTGVQSTTIAAGGADGSINYGAFADATAAAAGGSDGWQSVPEPTSGLLLLLGVAGLALRRRRA